jgi:hypothetical protein
MSPPNLIFAVYFKAKILLQVNTFPRGTLHLVPAQIIQLTVPMLCIFTLHSNPLNRIKIDGRSICQTSNRTQRRSARARVTPSERDTRDKLCRDYQLPRLRLQ